MKGDKMDPITISLITAISSGVAGGLAQHAVVDAYQKLKGKLVSKYGNDVSSAIDKLEKRPESDNCKGMLDEEINLSQAGKDKEIIDLANNLSQLLQSDNSSQVNVLNSQVGVIGDNARVDGGIYFGASKG
jgi:hypothetical protein